MSGLLLVAVFSWKLVFSLTKIGRKFVIEPEFKR